MHTMDSNKHNCVLRTTYSIGLYASFYVSFPLTGQKMLSEKPVFFDLEKTIFP